MASGEPAPGAPPAATFATDDIRITAPNVDAEGLSPDLRKDCVLFYYPVSGVREKKTSGECGVAGRPSVCDDDVPSHTQQETEALAHKIAARSGGRVTLGDIKWASFADGFPNLFVKDATVIRNRHVAFLASFQSYASIFEQLSIIYQLPRMFVGSFTLVLPYFPTGTAERVEAEGDVATAVTLARILSNIPLSRGGPTSVVIFDIHALQERFYFGDTVLPLFESGIPLLRARLASLPDRESVTIAYPDEGAWKRFHYQFGDYPEVICTKVRDGDKRIVRLKEGAPRGRHVVIVDDLVQSGGTLLECAKLLKLTGATEVSAYVTHGVFPKGSHTRFSAAVEGVPPMFKYFWITDSCPSTAAAVEGVAPFEVLSLAGLISQTLQI